MFKTLQKILLLSLMLFAVHAKAQILAPYANFSDTVNLSVTEGPDSIFVFNADNDSTYIIVDTQNYAGYTIQWEEYRQAVGFVPIAAGEKIYFTTDSIAKGYRLILTNGGSTVILRCWVLKNDFEIKITSKDFGDTLWVDAYSQCDRLDPVHLRFNEAHMVYYNPQTHARKIYFMDYKFIWEKEQEVNEGNIIKYMQYENIHVHRIVEPYWEGMWYRSVVTDSAGLEKRDSMFVRSIVPKAEFAAPVYIELSDSIIYPDRSDGYYTAYGTEYKGNISAPAKYYFISKDSKNAHDFFWSFGDTSKILRTTEDTVIHTYNYWGDFEPYLVARHTFQLINKECTDTMKLEKQVTIEKPKLMAPNAFSPPSGDNPIWRFYDVTTTYFDIVIFNRNGLKVHDFKGNIRDWDGWDGHYKNSTNIVPTGVYFYVVKKYHVLPNIDSKLNEDVEWGGSSDNTQYKGSIHVFNTEQ